ncbi:DNA-directed RNA polymerase I subunit RPA2 [Gurleya vavrai]
MYQCQMAKQTMGTAFHNHKVRSDNKAYKIIYPQSPLVKTNVYEEFKFDDYPMGINAIVAVLSYTGYDMEDAMVINKSSMERGFFYGSVYKTEIVELENKDDKVIELPEIGKWLGNSDLFYRIKKNNGEIKNILYKGFDKGIVESVRIFNKNEYNLFTFSVVLRIPRNPSIGDKFCSRHGQKGVCSMHWPAIDMPFTENGIVPDIIINPHAFPSRMTIGMLIESMAGKSGCLLGKSQNGTAFQFNSIEKNEENNFDKKTVENISAIDYFGRELENNGYNYYGNEIMHSGITGDQFKAEIFIGVVYYQRLRHMVNDKFQVRTTGAVQTLTRQPVGGRKNKGGVRLGEMERDALISHGVSYILQDRLQYGSDYTEFLYCVSCKSVLFCAKNKCICGETNTKL